MTFQMKMIIAITAALITPVENHPGIRSGMGVRNVPMTFGFDAISIISTMIGTAATPLMTALQNSALIGSIDVKSSARPTIATARDASSADRPACDGFARHGVILAASFVGLCSSDSHNLFLQKPVDAFALLTAISALAVLASAVETTQVDAKPDEERGDQQSDKADVSKIRATLR